MTMIKQTIILAAVCVLGFALRWYSPDFPSIGYHNMKENEYLSMSEEMLRTGDFLTRRIYFYNAFAPNPTMQLYPQPPLVSYQILAAWKLFGQNLWGPRLINIVFGTLTIPVVYASALVFFSSVPAALFSAFLLAIMPLGVFFSRNLQPESPAFLFLSLGVLCYLRFFSSFRKYNLVIGGFSFFIAWLYKFSFLIGLLPLLFCFPYRRLLAERKERLGRLAAFILPYLAVLAAMFWLKRIGQWQFEQQETLGRIRLFALFTPDYWLKYGRMIWWYVSGENFTIIYALLAAFGILAAFIRRKGLVDRYLIGSVAAIVLYGMVFSDHINQHNYYQMPFLGMVCIASAYTVFAFSRIARAIFDREVFAALAVAVAAVSAPFAYAAISRMHGTVYLGLDVAGESLKEFTRPDERVFLLTFAQGYGIARYAQRYVGWTDDLKDFQEKEQGFGIRYICFYPAELAHVLRNKNPELFAHIRHNYHVKEVGMSEEPNKIYYVILERGRGSDEDENFLTSFSGAMQLKTIYKMFGRYVFFNTLRVIEQPQSP